MMLNNKKKIFLFIFLMITLFLSTFSSASNISSQKICFTSDRFGNYDLFLVNADGSHLKRLTKNKLDEINPVWSADGKKILFLSKKGNIISTNYDLWVINADGNNLTKIDSNISVSDGQDPKWSPDSSKIIYVRKENKRLKLFDLTTYSSSDLLNFDVEGGYPSWSPDGDILAYINNKDEKGIYLISSEGSIKKKLIDDRGSYDKLSWSPDGSKFAYIYWKPFFGLFSKKTGIYVVDKDGKKGKYIDDATLYYNWCPDNKSIAFIDSYRTNYKSDNKTYYSTYVVNAEINNKKNKPQKLIGSKILKSYPSWSPDGMKIAYKYDNVVYIRESASSKLIKIVAGYGLTTTPSWSPDSKNITVVGYPENSYKNTDIFIFNYKDGQVYNLTNTNEAHENTPVWAPNSNEQ